MLDFVLDGLFDGVYGVDVFCFGVSVEFFFVVLVQ